MILTPIPAHSLSLTLGRFAASLEEEPSRAVLARLEASGAERARGEAARRHRDRALALAAEMGMLLKPGRPSLDFGWDGRFLRTDTEAYVLLHEIAHWQLAPAERRAVPEFGLGPGPETGARDLAETAALVIGMERETEEALASLLGILWEAELEQPALASFLDQNWLEGAGRRGASAHFERVLRRLREAGFLDPAMRPTCRCRAATDPADWYRL